MAKENKKLKQSQLKEEKERLLNLVTYAYKCDPRIRLQEEKQKQEKEKYKRERDEQREKERLIEEERNLRLKLEFEENLRRQKEENERLKISLFSELKELFTTNDITLSDSDLFQIELNLKVEPLKHIISEVNSETDPIERVKKLKLLSSSYFSLKFQENNLQSTIWSKDEINLLQRAVKKFPAGTKSRWERITEMVKTKPQSQIIELAHILATQPSLKIDKDLVKFKF